MNVLFIGLGYSVAPLAEELQKQGHTVIATTRSEEKARRLEDQGFKAMVWEAPAALDLGASNLDALVISVAPSQDGCPAAQALVGEVVGAGTHILYLSSSGVYGDYDGAWIDEDAQCRPGTERGQLRLAAEEQWRTRADAGRARLTLCRLAGIYGPGRNAVQSLRGDTPGARAGLTRRTIKPGQVFNRIHRDDIAAGLGALLRADNPPPIVNFADDAPGPPADVITYAAELLGIEPPPEVHYEDIKDSLSPMARSFYAENKRLKNDRLKALPGFALQYPSYREGLKAILAG